MPTTPTFRLEDNQQFIRHTKNSLDAIASLIFQFNKLQMLHTFNDDALLQIQTNPEEVKTLLRSAADHLVSETTDLATLIHMLP